MANTYTGKTLLLDTANDDNVYDSTHDFKNGGAKYSTERFKIQSIEVIGAADGDDIEIDECRIGTDGSFGGQAIFIGKMEAGDLDKTIEFPGGKWVQGILPKTLDGSASVLINLL